MQAIIKEMELRSNEADFLPETLYFGGGSPSILDEESIESLFDGIHRNFNLSGLQEITIECNPDDISYEKLKLFKSLGINRISLGVQSFRDEDLQWMRRIHTSHTADRSIKMIQDSGFENMSIDLIYGLPNLLNDHWMQNIEKTVEYGIPHISSYALTAEPKTLYQHQIQKKSVPAPDDEKMIEQFYMMLDYFESNGYVHYEISNFSFPNFESRHNTNYWKRIPYIGLGPSAHSYSGDLRSWNVANNHEYIRKVSLGELPSEMEVIDDQTRYNEYVMVALRMHIGIDIREIENMGYESYFIEGVTPYLLNGDVEICGTHYKLTKKGKIFADKIASDIFFVSK